MANLGLSGKTCIVTGASRGIGLATAKLLAQEGVRVALVARSAELLRQQADAIALEPAVRAAGGSAGAYVCDVTDPTQLQRLVAQVEGDFGAIQLAFLNAGNIFGMGPIVTTPLQRYRDSIATNLTSVFAGLQQLTPALQRAGGGAIVVNAALAGLRGRPGIADYSAAKWGAVGLTQAAAIELGKAAIRVNAIAPGYIATDSWLALLGTQAESLAARVPLQRLGRAEDVASVVLWLLSDASRYVTATVLPIDGGLGAL